MTSLCVFTGVWQIQRGEGVRAFQYQEMTTVISTRMHIFKNPVALQEGRPEWFHLSLTRGCYRSLGGSQTPQAEQLPSQKQILWLWIASLSLLPRWPLLHVRLLWSRDRLSAKRDAGSKQKALDIPTPFPEKDLISSCTMFSLVPLFSSSLKQSLCPQILTSTGYLLKWAVMNGQQWIICTLSQDATYLWLLRLQKPPSCKSVNGNLAGLEIKSSMNFCKGSTYT